MSKPKALPPPTAEERERARVAAAELRAAIADPAVRGQWRTVHADLSRPRRGQWWTTWDGLPGFTRVHCSKGGTSYHHECLPGWQYTRDEVRSEMIPDLEALAERGERPTTASEAHHG